MSELTQFGQYILLRKIASGGMAELYLGKQIGLQGFEKPVVLKRILPHLSENEEFITMFLDEARVAARLNHPRIAQIYDLGREMDSYFIAMEYIRGQDLRKIIKRAQTLREPVPLAIALHILTGVLEGLDHAHRMTDGAGKPLGLVHRDVSPQNILVSYEGDVKLVDFGIAKANIQIYQTRAGVLKGKYAYMSPEQAQGLPVDRRSDVFAAGILLYEVTTGHRLFRQPSEIETLKKVVECELEPPRKVSPSYPPDLEEIVLRALRKDPAERFQEAREMQLALEAFLRRHAILVSSVRLAEYMHRLFAREIEANAAEMRVLMDARPGTPPPGISLSPWPPPARDEPGESPPGGGSGPEEPLAAEPTLLLGPTDLVTLASEPPTAVATPTPGRRPGASRPVSASAPALREVRALPPRIIRRRRRILLAVTGIAACAAAAVVVWRLEQQRETERAATAPGPSPAPPALPLLPAPSVAALPSGSPAPAPASPAPEVAAKDDDPAETARPRRRIRRRRPAPAPATLVVRSMPATEVLVDGKRIGETPIEDSRDSGTVTVWLRNRTLGIEHRARVTLRPGERTLVSKVFGKGTLKVSVEPWAEVILDGRSLGETPVSPQHLWEGEHVLILRNARLAKRETLRVRIRPGETTLVQRSW